MTVVTLIVEVPQEAIDFYYGKDMHPEDILEQLKLYILDQDPKDVLDVLLTPTLIACIIEPMKMNMKEVQDDLTYILGKGGYVINSTTGRQTQFNTIAIKEK